MISPPSLPTVRVPERAAQIWPILALAARNRQVLTYGIIAKLISVPTAALGQLLEPIQSYCLLRKLPPLTALVVSSESGLPGAGFIAAAELPREQMRVMEFDWLAHGCPKVDDLADAVRQLPSKGRSELAVSP